MSSQNIIVFSDAAIDIRFIAKLFGASIPYINSSSPFHSVFEPRFCRVAIDGRDYFIHHIAGIPSSRMGRSSLQAPEVLKNLHCLTRSFNQVHLLIYVVRTDKPTSNNFRFFYDYLCYQNPPFILVQTTHTPLEVSWFDLVLTLDGADPESDKVNLHKVITKNFNRSITFVRCSMRFEAAARGCWKLLGKEASWSLADFRDALKLDYQGVQWLTEKDANAICKGFIEQVSVGDDIQQRVDAILSSIIAVGNVTPIPFLSVATESIVNIGETVQVCVTTIDLRS
jgi:hypothetical protein